MNCTKIFLLTGALLELAIMSSGIATAQSTTTEAAQADSQASRSQSAVGEDRITVLYDAFGRDASMKKDWGFSALIEVQGKRILFDTGNNSTVLAQNVKAKGVDLTRLDFVVMSHRHGDHMGGLSYVLSVNSFPAGKTDLDPRTEQLKQIRIEATRPKASGSN